MIASAEHAVDDQASVPHRPAHPAAGRLRSIVTENLTAVVVAVCSLLAGLAGFVFWSIIGHQAQAETVGTVASWLAFLPMLATAAALGQSENLMRHLHHTNARALTRTVYCTVGGGVAVVAAISLALPILSDRADKLWNGPLTGALCLAVALAASTTSSLASAIALVRKKPLLLLLDAVPSAVVKIGLAAVVGHRGPTAIALAVIAGSVTGSVAINVGVASLKALPLKPVVSIGRSYALGNLAASLISALPGSLTPAMIANAGGERSAAMTAIPLMLLPGLTLIPSAMARSLMAEGSRHLDKAVSLTKHKTVQATVISAVVTGSVAACARPLLSIIGDDYTQAVTPLRLCALAAFLATPAYMLETLLSIQKRVVTYTATSVVTTVVSLAGAVIYAKDGPSHVFGVWAAAAAIGTAIALAATFTSLRDNVHLNPAAGEDAGTFDQR